jgi:hypothetical protein
MQQWYQGLYAQGLDTPIERSVHLVLRLAAGDRKITKSSVRHLGIPS